MKIPPILSLFSSNSNEREVESMARPSLTEKALTNIRSQVRANPLAGKGIYSIEQLENDAIIAHWNMTATLEADPLVLKTPEPQKAG